MPFFETGQVRIRYEEVGSGYPLLLLAPGGLNSALDNWKSGPPFNPMEAFASDFRMIAMDQRNAHRGQSTGPVEANDPWGAFAHDQIALMDHLGIQQFFALGFCIGCSFSLSLALRAPGRVTAAVLCQPIGHRPEDPDVMYESGVTWGKELLEKRADVDQATIDRFLHNMYRSPADFVYSVSRDFVRACPIPLLVLPGNDRPHPHEVGVEVANLAPRAVTRDPWKAPELTADTVERIRSFLKEHMPVPAGR